MWKNSLFFDCRFKSLLILKFYFGARHTCQQRVTDLWFNGNCRSFFSGIFLGFVGEVGRAFRPFNNQTISPSYFPKFRLQNLEKIASKNHQKMALHFTLKLSQMAPKSTQILWQKSKNLFKSLNKSAHKHKMLIKIALPPTKKSPEFKVILFWFFLFLFGFLCWGVLANPSWLWGLEFFA